MSDPLDLTGRVAVVTGASRGIGRAIAETLAEHGASLILNGRSDSADLQSAAGEIADAFKVRVSCVAGDVADPATANALVREAFTTYRRLDVYVNNAGVLLDALVGMVTDQDIQKTLSVNLVGVINGIQAAARLMQRGGGGSIINISSIIGRFGNTGQLVYSASKAGVIGATLSAAKELAPKNVRVNAIAPGLINTDMVRQLPDDKRRQREDAIGMGRIGEPADVANAVLFLASDLSAYVTGQVIGVDGGMLV